jgi:hypothetical protein
MQITKRIKKTKKGTIIEYLNGHFSAIEFIFSIRVKSKEKREVGPINALPIIGVTIKCNKTRLKLGLNSDL